MNTFPRWLIAASAVLLLALVAGGAWYYHAQQQDVRQNAEANLASIARLKVAEIVQWRGERRGDAAVFAQSPSMTGAVDRWMAQPGSEDRRAHRGRVPVADEQLPLSRHSSPGRASAPLVFYLRTTPFSPNSWNNLNSHHLLTTDIMVQNTATSEENIYNYYIVICTNDAVIAGTPQLAATAFTSYDPILGRPKVPIYDTESTLKYGLRQFPIQQTKYVDFISEDVGGILRSGISK